MFNHFEWRKEFRREFCDEARIADADEGDFKVRLSVVANPLANCVEWEATVWNKGGTVPRSLSTNGLVLDSVFVGDGKDAAGRAARELALLHAAWEKIR